MTIPEQGLDAPVGIVGAGPVGLAAAARLAQLGIPSVILEAEPHLRHSGSKACLIQGDVVEVLDKLGCAGDVAAEGIRWNVARTYVRGQEIIRTVYRLPIGYGPFVNISQFRIEQILLAHVEKDSLLRVHWRHPVTAVRQDGDGVTVTAGGPDGPRTFQFGYVLAADGVRSVMRDLLGVEWTGYSHGDLFLITDLRADAPFAHERHFHYDPPFNPGRQLVIHAQPDQVWRIDWQLGPDADIEAEKANGDLDRRIRQVIGDIPYEIKWLSTYRFNQRVVDNFRAGRVFFAGDAAHALPPYGARGMNSGLQDADNLAWKLAFVLRGYAPDALLDTYHTERHAAALDNLSLTEATIQFMVPPSRWKRMSRSVILAASLLLPWTRRFVNSGTMAEPNIYRDSPVIGSGPLAGMFAPDAWVRDGLERRRLRTVFGEDLVLLYAARDASGAACFASATAAATAGLPARAAVLLPPGVTPPADCGVRVLTAENTAVHADYPPGHWFVVRPDGYVAAAGADLAELAGSLERSLAGSRRLAATGASAAERRLLWH
jgi:3-(3-hydroxy-phenyl)propionate hydroxylase